MPRLLIHETGIHFVDVFRYLLGEPEWVSADLRRRNPARRGGDAGIFNLGVGDGVRAGFDGNRLADLSAANRRLVMGEGLVEGSSATLTLDGEGGLRRRANGENDGAALAVAIRSDRFGGGCVEALQSHVVAHLRDGGPAENTGRAYLRNMEIVEAIYRAAETGCREALA
jgi:predicted dehydrogenase